MGKIDQRMAELGIVLPAPGKPVANYVSWVRTGNLIFISGQLPMQNGKPAFVGQVRASAEGAKAARLCAINILSLLRDACGGNLDRVVRIIRLGGFVNIASDAEGLTIPHSINGASELMVEVFDDLGKHARTAVGVSDLPLNASVEVEALVEII
jgi:enamine deaminase RidA (YjgF/YER057c/UK114 family)